MTISFTLSGIWFMEKYLSGYLALLKVWLSDFSGCPDIWLSVQSVYTQTCMA
jgi:hypothetical protein